MFSLPLSQDEPALQGLGFRGEGLGFRGGIQDLGCGVWSKFEGSGPVGLLASLRLGSLYLYGF